MQKLLLSFISASALLLVASTASAAAAGEPAGNLKVGIIDVQQIMQKSPQIAVVNEQLTKEFKPRQDKIIASQKSLQDEIDKLNRNGSVMSPVDRNKLQDQIDADKSSLQSMSVAFQRDLSTAQNQAMQGFMSQLTADVNNIAKTQNYDLILQRSGVPYANPKLDITSEVLAGLKK